MRRRATFALQVLIVLSGVGALAFLIWEPHIEGRNAHATLVEIYFNDPFLAFAYVGSIPFFVALYQAFTVGRHAGQDHLLSQPVVRAVRTFKYCAITIIGFVAVGEIIIMLSPSDDRAGGVLIGVLIAGGSIAVAIAAARFGRRVQRGVDARSNGDAPASRNPFDNHR